MEQITIRRWDSAKEGPLTEATVREKFSPSKYRVSVYRYPLRTKFGGASMRAGTCHVISGVVRYVFKSEAILRRGDVAELPGGAYSLEVIGDEELVNVLCWELPPEVRPS